jgi:hypothetical protein
MKAFIYAGFCRSVNLSSWTPSAIVGAPVFLTQNHFDIKESFYTRPGKPATAPRRRLPTSKNFFRRQAGSERFAQILRRFARNARLARRRARTRIQRNAAVRDCAKRSRSASFFVSVAHTSNAFSYCGYSSPSANPATMFSLRAARRLSCAGRGRAIATSWKNGGKTARHSLDRSQPVEQLARVRHRRGGDAAHAFRAEHRHR